MPERYYRELLRYFTRKAGDGDAAADVVQEAYTRMLSLKDRGGAVIEPRALLYQTGRNLLASQAVKQASERRMLETLAMVGADSAPSTERHACARQQLARLIALLEGMPRKRREAFILVRVHGKSYVEAGRHMEVSEIAIERHMMRALMDCAGYAGR